MFIGYQNDKIAFVADTRDELENMPCVVLDRIEESIEPYALYKGEFLPSLEIDNIIRKENIENRISELKNNLTNTDYVIIKLAEDAASRDEYADVLANRKLWRAEINELELSLVDEVID